MSRCMRAGVLIAVLLMVSFQGATAKQGQESDVPNDCPVRPVAVLSLLAMLNDMNQSVYVPPLSSISSDQIVPGTSVDAQDMEGITDTTTALVGCANSLQVMSVMALLTEDFQARLVSQVIEGEDMDAVVEQLPILATEAAENGGIQDIPIDSAWYAEGNDRMIMAILEPVSSDPASQRSFLVTYAFSVDQWLIHDIQPIIDSGSN